MQMINHSCSPDTEYHFETSDEYCDPEVVSKAEKFVLDNMNLTPSELAQLAAIVELENIRYHFAKNSEDINTHGKKIQIIRNTLIENHGLEPFDNGKLENAFYKALNKEYGYVI